WCFGAEVFMRRFIAICLSLFWIGCGLPPARLSPETKTEIKTVGIISSVGNVVTRIVYSPSISRTKYFSERIERNEWKFDDALIDALITALSGQYRVVRVD